MDSDPSAPRAPIPHCASPGAPSIAPASIHLVGLQEEEPRRQSLVAGPNVPELHKILAGSDPSLEDVAPPAPIPASSGNHRIGSLAAMLTRKIWVRRPGASATMVTIREDDLVDDVRDKILQKYANSLGRTFDSPDVTLRIASRSDVPRSQPQERLLGPEEDMCRTLDSYYPGGQTVSEALVIDIPPKKTPRPSPRQHAHHPSNGHNNYHSLEEFRPTESGTDYFPPMPAVLSTVNGQTATIHDPRTGHAQVLQLPEHTRSISVLQTGQVPPLPSPGAATRRHRPKYARQHTSSPTILAHTTNPSTVIVSSPNPAAAPPPPHLSLRPSTARPRHDSAASERPNGAPAPPPLPTPPAPESGPGGKNASTPPTPVPREHHRLPRPRKTRKVTPTNTKPSNTAASISSLLDGSVPPINVLIVEDNIINLKLLEAFMKRLKVRWSTAMNGQIAVNKWRGGGFHLVLMDIQLPIMSGLDATKEIRRLERVNGIGVFSNSQPGTPAAAAAGKREVMREESGDSQDSQDTVTGGDDNGEHQVKKNNDDDDDRLDMSEGLFKSPVIIVALTASSLQSDRHEALAAGCNDFLTKPVNFVWLERKVKEWGCMQALIDFDGWRKWKDFSTSSSTATTTNSTAAAPAVPTVKEDKTKEDAGGGGAGAGKLKDGGERRRERARKRMSAELAGSIEVEEVA